MTREEPEIVNSHWEEDPVILGAILEIQSAITKIAPIVKVGVNLELEDALSELEQAVRWLKGES